MDLEESRKLVIAEHDIKILLEEIATTYIFHGEKTSNIPQDIHEIASRYGVDLK